MELKTRHIILIVLFTLYFSARLFFSLQTPEFSSDYSYFALRQIEHIQQTGLPLSDDLLSYGGRNFVVMPFYFYILAALTMFLPEIITIKIVNTLLASSLIAAMYLVCRKVLQNRRVSIICFVVAATMPVYISQTLNDISPLSLILPGSLFLLYLFLVLEKKRAIDYAILLSIVLALVSSSSFILLLGFIVYLILKYLDKHAISKARFEFTAFFLLFLLWINIIVYKQAFQEHSFSIVLRNLPQVLLDSYFADLSIQKVILGIGVFPFFFGLYTVSIYLFRKKSENILLFISLFISAFGLLWFKVVEIEVALAFLGIALAVLFGQALKSLRVYMKRTKFAKRAEMIFNILLVVLMISHIFPGVYLIYQESGKSFSTEYIEGFRWLANNTPEDSVVLALPEEGHLVAYFGKRKNVIDNDFLLVGDANERFNDVLLFYTWRFKVPAVRVLEKYSVDYVIVSEKIKDYRITENLLKSESCFVPVYEGSITVYRNRWDKDVCSVI